MHGHSLGGERGRGIDILFYQELYARRYTVLVETSDQIAEYLQVHR